MKIQTIEDFARPQDLAALRGVTSRLVTRFPENGEILDLIKAEYRAGRPLPDIERAVAARIETGEALPLMLAKAQRNHLRKIRGG
jgi:predicted ATPase